MKKAALVIGEELQRVKDLEGELRDLGFDRIDGETFRRPRHIDSSDAQREALNLADVVIFLVPPKASLMQAGDNAIARGWLEAAAEINYQRPAGAHAVIVVDARVVNAQKSGAVLQPIFSSVGVLESDRFVVENLRGWS